MSSHSWNKRENILQTAGRARSAQKQRAIRLFSEQKTNCIGQFGKERAKRSLRKGRVYISIDMYTHICMYVHTANHRSPAAKYFSVLGDQVVPGTET